MEDFLNKNIGIKAIYEFGNLDDFNELFINALIIEWFDSVGIYIEINVNQITDKNKNIPKCNFDSAIFHVKHRSKEGRTLTQLKVNANRQEATEQAIKKANEIYNNES